MKKSSEYISKLRKNITTASWADPVKRANIVAGLRRTAVQRGKTISEVMLRKYQDDPEWASWRKALMHSKLNAGSAQLRKRSERGRVMMLSAEFQEAAQKARKQPRKSEKTKRNSLNHSQAVNVELRDPNGQVWQIKNLVKFIREHEYLFDPADVIWEGKYSCRCKAANSLRALWRKSNPPSSSKGWTLVSATEVFYNNGEDLLERQNHATIVNQ